MQKILMIHPYFGSLPEYFSEWLHTANQLKDSRFDFLIVSDIDMSSFFMEDHIKVLYTTLTELKQRISKAMGFEVSLEKPYKLCDYKPAYGFIFSQEVNSYDFWGCGDVDVLWGRLDNYITDEMLEKYDRIGYLGHFSLYRNIPEMNCLFMKKGMFSYKKVYRHDYVYGFDEDSGMMYISLKHNIKTYTKKLFANISWRTKELMLGSDVNYKYQVFYWENGGVYRAYIDDNELIQTEEYMYLHFQGKKPKSICANMISPSAFYLTKDKFIVKTEPLTIEKLKEISGVNKENATSFVVSSSKRSMKKKFSDLVSKLRKQRNLKERIIIVKKKIAQRYVGKKING